MESETVAPLVGEVREIVGAMVSGIIFETVIETDVAFAVFPAASRAVAEIV